MITISNRGKGANVIYCARGSALGNPFYMKSEKYRDEVCDKYEEWFYSVVDEPNFLALASNPVITIQDPVHRHLVLIFNKAMEGDVDLSCFCAPKRCHCETIRHFIELKLGERFK